LEELTESEFDDARLVNVRVPAGLRDRIAGLPIRRCADAISRSQLALADNPGNSELVFALYLAVSLARFGEGRQLQLDAGQHISLVDHPISVAVQSVVDEVATGLDVDLPSEELAGLTEYALGLDAIASVVGSPRNVKPLVEKLLSLAADRLHPSLAEDAELQSSLAMHLTRLSVRLRHGLPVHNPLLDEIVERYPEVYAVAQDARPVLNAEFDADVTDDEIGFITMYLSGALERSYLRPQKQALIVCPSGMATVWVLVSRVQAEFPALSIAQVLSARQLEDQDLAAFDIVISTVSLDSVDAPVVVVSPLLSAADIRAVGEHL
jgi:galactitol-specific phosphotransferase system IIB component